MQMLWYGVYWSSARHLTWPKVDGLPRNEVYKVETELNIKVFGINSKQFQLYGLPRRKRNTKTKIDNLHRANGMATLYVNCGGRSNLLTNNFMSILCHRPDPNRHTNKLWKSVSVCMRVWMCVNNWSEKQRNIGAATAAITSQWNDNWNEFRSTKIPSEGHNKRFSYFTTHNVFINIYLFTMHHAQSQNSSPENRMRFQYDVADWNMRSFFPWYKLLINTSRLFAEWSQHPLQHAPNMIWYSTTMHLSLSFFCLFRFEYFKLQQ